MQLITSPVPVDGVFPVLALAANLVLFCGFQSVFAGAGALPQGGFELMDTHKQWRRERILRAPDQSLGDYTTLIWPISRAQFSARLSVF